jgi:hypothetical protein
MEEVISGWLAVNAQGRWHEPARADISWRYVFQKGCALSPHPA